MSDIWMQAPLIQKIARFPMREVWPHEALHFTTWLSQNLDVIATTLGMDLTLIEREAAAGDFSVDLLAEDGEGQTVIIENQLGKSDHDHLGKLLTYVAAYEAQIAVWIVGDPRPEHTKAVAWLNDSSSARVFLLRAEAVRIGNSPPALLLTPVIGPSETSKLVAKDKQERSERHELRREFWRSLLEVASPLTRLHATVSPSESTWISTSAGRSGFAFNYVALREEWRVELYLDTGDARTNKRLFDKLSEHRQEIERQFGGSLEWQRLDDKQACRITTSLANGGYRSDGDRPTLQRKMVDAMIRLDRAIRPLVLRLPKTSGNTDIGVDDSATN